MLSAVHIVLLLSILGSLVNLLPGRFWLQELNIALSCYYLCLHLLSLCVLVPLRRRFAPKALMVVCSALLLLCAYYARQLVPFYVRASRAAPAPETLKLLVADLSGGAAGTESLKRLIEARRPDLMVLTALSRACRGLELCQAYPFSHEIIRGDGFGLGLYSRHPMLKPAVESIGQFLPPVIITEIAPRQEGVLRRRIKLVVFHAPAPVSVEAWLANALTVRRVATRLKQSRGDLIVAGAMNATPFSRAYKMMLFHGRLKDAMWGFGLRRTWDAGAWYARFTLDHVLYRGALEVKSFEVLDSIGSEHLPGMTEFVLGAPEAALDEDPIEPEDARPGRAFDPFMEAL
jgi:endonuclease/exonuclease/phosphatase (EEP) superfamily protein YafD